MSVITIRLDDQDKALIKDYAKFKEISISELCRNSILEAIENEIDINLYNTAVSRLNDPDDEEISFDDAKKQLGLS